MNVQLICPRPIPKDPKPPVNHQPKPDDGGGIVPPWFTQDDWHILPVPYPEDGTLYEFSLN